MTLTHDDHAFSDFRSVDESLDCGIFRYLQGVFATQVPMAGPLRKFPEKYSPGNLARMVSRAASRAVWPRLYCGIARGQMVTFEKTGCFLIPKMAVSSLCTSAMSSWGAGGALWDWSRHPQNW